jgi:uncharacterized membrane protein
MTLPTHLPLALVAANVGEDAAGAVFRWGHILAGVLWIGMLYFFNFVNGELAKTYDPDSKKKVVPELMPRALFWFRWGAAWTYITGVLMWLILYVHQPNFQQGSGVSAPAQPLAAMLLILVGFGLYNQIAKGMAKRPIGALFAWYCIVFAFGFSLSACTWFGASNRAIYIHCGAMLGTAMAANVWMIIWPCQRRIITAIKSGTAPDAADVALAGLRSRHNTFMSVPLLFLMLAVHQDFIGISFVNPGQGWMVLIPLFLVGYFFTDWMYKKAAQVKGF